MWMTTVLSLLSFPIRGSQIVLLQGLSLISTENIEYLAKREHIGDINMSYTGWITHKKMPCQSHCYKPQQSSSQFHKELPSAT
jgi:hypothetical protein